MWNTVGQKLQRMWSAYQVKKFEKALDVVYQNGYVVVDKEEILVGVSDIQEAYNECISHMLGTLERDGEVDLDSARHRECLSGVGDALVKMVQMVDEDEAETLDASVLRSLMKED